MQVVAISMGFYNGARKRPGDKFEMPEADMRMPRWVQPADKPLPLLMSEEDKAKAAAIAAAGPKKPGTPAPKVGGSEDLV